MLDRTMPIQLLLVEDNDRLRQALKAGLENVRTGLENVRIGQENVRAGLQNTRTSPQAAQAVEVVYDCASGEAAVEYCLEAAASAGDDPAGAHPLPQAALFDVQLAGKLNGIQAAVAIRRELPRFPAVFYSIQDDDAYYRDFRQSGILSHYAYVRKTNYLLPEMIVPLLRDAVGGRSFIDPEIEARVQEVRHKDEQAPMALLEPNEQVVARLLAQGLTNEQIAGRMGFKDKRTISRTNGQIYVSWGLADTATDEKVARTRAALIVQTGRLIQWDADGNPHILDSRGSWIPFSLDNEPE